MKQVFGVVLPEKKREEDMLRNLIYLFIIILLIILYQMHFLHFIMYFSKYFLGFFHLRVSEKISSGTIIKFIMENWNKIKLNWWKPIKDLLRFIKNVPKCFITHRHPTKFSWEHCYICQKKSILRDWRHVKKIENLGNKLITFWKYGKLELN